MIADPVFLCVPMIRFRTLLVSVPLLVACAAIAQPSMPPVGLHGEWEGEVNGARYVEQWTCANGVCDGKATSYRGDQVAMEETTRIMEFAGQWILLVAVDRQPTIAFKCIHATATTWVFENAEHDFPQRISYTVAGDVLDAHIVGPGKESEVRMDFHLKRVK